MGTVRGEPGKSGVKSYRDLVAWQKGMDLAGLVYRATTRFPSEERFGLVAQMRRAAVSVPANVAEGFGRGGRADFRRFVLMARGSLFELQTHGELARRLGWLKGKTLTLLRQDSQELDAILRGLIRSLGKTE
ncbi:MAG TPA: four helix bundle protein [Phycisphaerae bacterium]|nr:four helix bundle protein [Phycisphaerae bacterium]